MSWGWLKRGKDPRLMSMVPETRLGTSTVKHHDVPRFGALLRDKTPTPAELTMSNNSGYNVCSLSSFRGRRRRPRVLLSPASLYVGGNEVNVDLALARTHAGGVPEVLIG